MKKFTLLAIIAITASTSFAQGTAFTYQGRLDDNGSPVTGIFDLRFRILDSTNQPGMVIAGPLTNSATGVTNGLFTVALDFGAGVFNGSARWLEIAVRANGAGAFSTLSPRQPLTASPYAVYAGGANAAGLSGTIAAANIADASISSGKLGANSVTSAQLAPDAVTTSDLAPNAVTASRIADSFQSGSISTSGTSNGATLTVTFPAPFEGIPVVRLVNAAYLTLSNITSTNFQIVVPPHHFLVDAPSPNIVARHLSLAAVGGNPAIAYYDETSGDLKYVRATSTNGSTWGTPVIAHVGGAILVGKYASLAVVNGRPAIAYMDDTGDNLLYVRASDANGTAWGAPVTVASPGDVGHYAQLKVVNGRPAIAYLDQTTNSLMFVRANDVDGTAWGTPVFVEQGASTNRVGEYASMEIVNSFPAVAYRAAGVDELHLCRALNVDGTAWDLPVVITANSGAKNVSLTMLSGRPGVSYVARETQVTYQYAANTNGTSWNSPIIVGSARSIDPSGTVLREIGGIPHLAFWHGQLGDVFYTRTTSATSGLWDPPVEILSGLGTSGGNVAMMAVGNRAVVAAKSRDSDLSFTTVALVPTSIQYTAREAVSLEATSVAAGSITREMLANGVLGNGVIATGNGAFAVGSFTRALYDQAFAAGDQSVASGESSFAGGDHALAAGFASVALGNGVKASGSSSVAMGFNTVASGSTSTALGDGTVASGTSSTALGDDTTAAGSQSFAAGQRARANHSGTFVWSDTSAGDFASTGSGQFLIRAADGVGINTNNPQARLHVNGTLRVDQSAALTSASLSSSLSVGGSASVSGNVTVGAFPVVAPSALVPVANSTLAPTTGYVLLTPAANVTLNTTTAIETGSDLVGRVLMLQGDGSFTVTVPDNANTRLSSAITLGNNDVLTLIWNGADWVQVSFSDN